MSLRSDPFRAQEQAGIDPGRKGFSASQAEGASDSKTTGRRDLETVETNLDDLDKALEPLARAARVVVFLDVAVSNGTVIIRAAQGGKTDVLTSALSVVFDDAQISYSVQVENQLDTTDFYRVQGRTDGGLEVVSFDVTGVQRNLSASGGEFTLWIWAVPS